MTTIEIEVIVSGDNYIMAPLGISGRRSEPDLNGSISSDITTISDRIFPNNSLLLLLTDLLNDIVGEIEPNVVISDIVLLDVIGNFLVGRPALGIKFVTTSMVVRIRESFSEFLDKALYELLGTLVDNIKLTSRRLTTI